jgi:hypothetical protein
VGEVFAFPVVRRRAMIQRHALLAAGYSPAGAVRHLDALVRKHKERLERLGVSIEAADLDAAALRNALLAMYFQLSNMSDGTA